MPASDEVLTTDSPGFALGELDRVGFEKKRLQIGNGVHCHVDIHIVARLRDKCLAVEKHPLQNRVGKDNVFVERHSLRADSRLVVVSGTQLATNISSTIPTPCLFNVRP